MSETNLTQDTLNLGHAVQSELERVIQGQPAAIQSLLVALTAGGHVLIEGVPGVAKTLLARSLAAALRCSFARIQFTPDLMPSDITGVNVFNAATGTFAFRPGPLFADIVLAERPDAVIVATGSMPDRAAIPGADGPEVVDVTDILSGATMPFKRVMIIDRLGFHEATSAAEYLAEQGCEVEVVTQTLFVGQDLGITLDLENWYRQARRLGITCTPNHSVLSIDHGVVTALHNYSGQIIKFPKVDTVVLAIHRKADHALYDALKAWVPDLHRIGDCVAPRRAHAAIIEGERAGRAV